jgi:hypothetical protein
MRTVLAASPAGRSALSRTAGAEPETGALPNFWTNFPTSPQRSKAALRCSTEFQHSAQLAGFVDSPGGFMEIAVAIQALIIFALLQKFVFSK